MGSVPDIVGELESLRRENARLRKLLKLTDAEVAPTHGTQSAWFDKAPGSVDASSTPEAKVLPQLGFLPPDDPRVRRTLEAIQRDLSYQGFLQRYRTEERIDGLPVGEGTFLPCSFWLVDALALDGRHDEAAELFEHLLSVRNDVGLLAEEYDPREERQLGNFPQAFSHVALINSALHLTPSAPRPDAKL
jgi:GH15 family glucan-1,4-alpha-glucosidase